MKVFDVFFSCVFCIFLGLMGCSPKGLDLYKHLEYTGYNPKEKLPYSILAPKKIEVGKKYPLVIFYHGSGARGTDNMKQLKYGPRLFVKPEIMKDYPCYVIAPQCPEGSKWVNVDWGADANMQPDKPSTPMRLSIELLRTIMKTYPVDATRVYVTGLSMGGFATWDAITRYPDLFAAAVPVCGGGDEHKAYLIQKLPIWAFHGAKDRIVKVIRTQNMIHAIEAYGGEPLYTEYPLLGHNAWDSAYKDDRILKWMFAQKKRKTN